jgi:hypothetical protein
MNHDVNIESSESNPGVLEISIFVTCRYHTEFSKMLLDVTSNGYGLTCCALGSKS